MTDVSTEAVGEWLTGRIAAYGQVEPSEITLDAPLADLGLDSVYGMTLCGDIEDAYGIDVDPAMLAEHGTLGGVAEAVAELAGRS